MLNIPKREESPERYDANKAINELISDTFKKSVSAYTANFPKEFEETHGTSLMTKSNSKYGHIPYAEKTLGESGCAVFCFEHGLRTRGIECNIEELAKEIGEKRYYFYGKGTYHNLFDHYGLRRASDVQEIFDALKMGKIVTVLVQNKLYQFSKSNEGSHFINIIGIDKHGYFSITDPSISGIWKYPSRILLKAIRVAWIW